MEQVQYSHTHTLLLVDNMKPVHIAMIAAAAAYLYYITSQRKHVSFTPVLPPFDMGPPGTGWDGEPIPAFKYPSRPFVPTPAYAYLGMGNYEQGMNWPARDNIFD